MDVELQLSLCWLFPRYMLLFRNDNSLLLLTLSQMYLDIFNYMRVRDNSRVLEKSM